MEQQLDDPFGGPAVDRVVDVALRTDEGLEEGDKRREEPARSHGAEEGLGKGLFGTEEEGRPSDQVGVECERKFDWRGMRLTL